eukprot:4554182-Lingulodinium_polyedra.AAC.1
MLPHDLQHLGRGVLQEERDGLEFAMSQTDAFGFLARGGGGGLLRAFLRGRRDDLVVGLHLGQ